MPLSVKWYDDEHSIILITIAADMTWDDYHDAVDWIVTEAAQVNHRVDIIFYDDVGMPKGNPMPHLRRGSSRIVNQPNTYYSIIAGSQGASGFTRVMLETLAKSYLRLARTVNPNTRGGIVFLRTLDEALAYIQKDRIRSSAE